MYILIQFLFRLAWGMALAMACTSPRLVTSGYFRVHLLVVLGLNTLAALVASAVAEFALWPALAGAICSYCGAMAWLYEKPAIGRPLLFIVSGLALIGAWQANALIPTAASPLRAVLHWIDPVTGGLVLGTTMAAMLLGHWYLNTPTMQLEPLKRLIKLMVTAVALRAAVSCFALAILLSTAEVPSFAIWAGIALRWLAGLLGTLGLAWMSWETLKIPNTQSATGILYVAVITTFLGELTSLLLSAEVGLPL